MRYSYVQTGMVLNPASTSYWIYRGGSLYRGCLHLSKLKYTAQRGSQIINRATFRSISNPETGLYFSEIDREG